jgi:hypothetical protein
MNSQLGNFRNKLATGEMPLTGDHVVYMRLNKQLMLH